MEELVLTKVRHKWTLLYLRMKIKKHNLQKLILFTLKRMFQPWKKNGAEKEGVREKMMNVLVTEFLSKNFKQVLEYVFFHVFKRHIFTRKTWKSFQCPKLNGKSIQNANKRRSRTAIFSVKVTDKKLVEQTTNIY